MSEGTAENPHISAEWLSWPGVQALFAHYQAAGFALRAVGGAVRDALLDRPVREVDFATTATPEQGTALLENAGIRVIPTGLAHGTLTALVAGQSFEITTLRRDVACDGRHAEVAFTTDWAEDAARRDFTLNALYADATGRVYDPLGTGQADLAARCLRFIGDPAARIAEDGLRILRFFRFAAELAIAPLDAAALTACAEAAPRLATISGERIRQEMLKLLAAPDPCAALDAMAHHRVLAALDLPEAMLPRLPQLLAVEGAPNPWVRLGLLLLPREGEAMFTLPERWRLANREWEGLLAEMLLARALLRGEVADSDAWKVHIRREGREVAEHALLIAQAVNPLVVASKEVFAEWRQLARTWPIPVFPLRGRDLLEHGFTPGKALGEQLDALERAWEASHYTLTREALLALVEQKG